MAAIAADCRLQSAFVRAFEYERIWMLVDFDRQVLRCIAMSAINDANVAENSFRAAARALFHVSSQKPRFKLTRTKSNSEIHVLPLLGFDVLMSSGYPWPHTSRRMWWGVRGGPYIVASENALVGRCPDLIGAREDRAAALD